MRGKTFSYRASLSEVTLPKMDLVSERMPQAHWKLLPDLDTASRPQPKGWIRMSIVIPGFNSSVTGRIHYLTDSGTLFQPSFWFTSDEAGRICFEFQIAQGAFDLYLTLYAAQANALLPQVMIKEISWLSRISGRLYDLTSYHLEHPLALFSKIYKFSSLILGGNLRAVLTRIVKGDRYAYWIARYDEVSAKDRRTMRKHIEQMRYKPLISILLPVHNPIPDYLCQAIDSVLRQTYSHWELCIADDASCNPRIREIVKSYAAKDHRIKYIFRETSGHISATTNSAGTLATGDFILFLDHDDELSEHALYMIARELDEHPNADLVFSDEDKLSAEGNRREPFLKSEWNPELMLALNCVCHIMVVRTELFHALGGLRSECDGAQDWDLALRISEKTTSDRIRHVPHILYHWRILQGSTARGIHEKPYVIQAQIRAVTEHLERTGVSLERVEFIPELSIIRPVFRVPHPTPVVSLIFPILDGDQDEISSVLSILKDTGYGCFELLLVGRSEKLAQIREVLQSRFGNESRLRFIQGDTTGSFVALANQGASQATGAFLGFLRSPIQVISRDWLHEMVGRIARQSDIVAVGARLLQSDGRIFHAGIILGLGGIARGQFSGDPMHTLGYQCRPVSAQNVSAVSSACILVRATAFGKVGGFDQDELSDFFNDIDLCLKLRKAGGLVVYTPYAELLHHESVSRGYEDSPQKKARFKREYQAMRERWGEVLTSDPYYNPNFSLKGVGYDLGVPPERFGPKVKAA